LDSAAVGGFRLRQTRNKKRRRKGSSYEKEAEKKEERKDASASLMLQRDSQQDNGMKWDESGGGMAFQYFNAPLMDF